MVTSGWREGFVGRSARQNIIEKGPSDSYDDGVQLLLGIVPGNTSRLVVESSEAVIISPTSACFIIATTQSVPFFFRSISQVGPLASYSLLLIFAPSVRPTLSLFLILFFFSFCPSEWSIIGPVARPDDRRISDFFFFLSNSFLADDPTDAINKRNKKMALVLYNKEWKDRKK